MNQPFLSEINKLRTLFQQLKSGQNLEVREEEFNDNLKEVFIQAVWNEKAQNRIFTTLDNRQVRIDYSGTWNDESGPDFKDGKVTFINNDVETTKQGDIELHLKAADWYNHKHENNPEFDNVILHVIWEESLVFPEHIPTVCLKNQLDQESLEQVSSFDWIYYPDGMKFPPCPLAPYLVVKSNKDLQNFFTAAAIIRFEEKVNTFKRHIIKVGREQALYQGIADALGYKNNREPFNALTTFLNYKAIKKFSSKGDIFAVIFGTSGLLPDYTSEAILPELKGYIKNLWEKWWDKRVDNLPEFKWVRRGRPFNSPERRLAALAELTAPPESIIDQIIRLSESDSDLVKNFEEVLQIKNEIWESLTSFKTKTKSPTALLGESRKREIIANILLPFTAALNESKNAKACEGFINLPTLQNNHLIKEAVNRFLIPTARAKEIMKNNGVQQGMIKLIKETKDINNLSPHHPLVKLLLSS